MGVGGGWGEARRRVAADTNGTEIIMSCPIKPCAEGNINDPGTRRGFISGSHRRLAFPNGSASLFNSHVPAAIVTLYFCF